MKNFGDVEVRTGNRNTLIENGFNHSKPMRLTDAFPFQTNEINEPHQSRCNTRDDDSQENLNGRSQRVRYPKYPRRYRKARLLSHRCDRTRSMWGGRSALGWCEHGRIGCDDEDHGRQVRRIHHLRINNNQPFFLFYYTLLYPWPPRLPYPPAECALMPISIATHSCH